jgi:hypothetical protein
MFCRVLCLTINLLQVVSSAQISLEKLISNEECCSMTPGGSIRTQHRNN